MYKPLESSIEKRITKFCAENGILQQKLLGKRGMPDHAYYFNRGVTVFIEYKRDGKDLNPLQKLHHTLLKKKQHLAYACDNASDALEILKKVLHETTVDSRKVST